LVQVVLEEFKASGPVMEILGRDPAQAYEQTLAALKANSPVIYQAALEHGRFAGFADFLLLDEQGRYQVWDNKLARSPRPYFIIQLCCYREMLAGMLDRSLSDRFGVILGTKERVAYRVEDFLHYYRCLKAGFLAMQDGFTGDPADRPEPLPRADHGRWASHAEQFFQERDHLVQVAGITTGQIKKLQHAGIATVKELAAAAGISVPKLNKDSLEKLVAQARLQDQTRMDRVSTPEAPPRYELLPQTGMNGEPVGLATLPPDHPADVFFDMEGYPLAPGGLEYLFGVCTRNGQAETWDFRDWWAHDREEERRALEGFIDWVYARWQAHPGMHIYHYAAYEVSAVRRLSTAHDTRQDQVDALLRNGVFVDLYQVVRHAVRIGEDSYSIKSVERLYRPKRTTDVATAADSMVQYAQWIESQQSRDWQQSDILKAIRDYNEDDCRSTGELLRWLRTVAETHQIATALQTAEAAPTAPPELSPETVARLETAAALRQQKTLCAEVLAQVIDFHRREAKPVWWRMFDRADATPDELRDDPGCIEGIQATGDPVPHKQSLVQAYACDPSQECKLAAGDRKQVMFTHNLDAKFTLLSLDTDAGRLELKIGKKSLNEKCDGIFPRQGSVLPDEYVNPAPIPEALTAVASGQLSRALHPPVFALLERRPPAAMMQGAGTLVIDNAVRIAIAMSGDCLVIQGPPGTGKTFTAGQVMLLLLQMGLKIGIASNSHKAVLTLMEECAKGARIAGMELQGLKVGGDGAEALLAVNPGIQYVAGSSEAYGAYRGGVIGGTAWLFTRPEWEGQLDYLFIDEAGQVSLANAVAMARCARNLVLIGDQMQLEQPIQGAHPGDAGLSVLQYALKDTKASAPDQPVFHPVVPPDYGLFLGESRRMHPSVCRFISESMYEGRLVSHPDCARQRIDLSQGKTHFITQEQGIIFSPVEHDGNTQSSDEEVTRILAIYHELLGRPYQTKEGSTRPLTLEDFLFIAPYNAQVRALQATLPQGARVGSVDKFQGQEAPVCILSLCSSYGEYGSRGLAFILDRNRINVAISRAQCLAVVVADPRISQAVPGSIDEMRLLNLFCKLLAYE
ncbi:MAG: TM0106 family RecB-like putative nuclease, partial [Nitrospira sp.]|nr:TM0106 family RecB-like putative nuclease [Nitrospira sp.]